MRPATARAKCDIYMHVKNCLTMVFDARRSEYRSGARLRRAQLMGAGSQYTQTRDNYRATVLAAFQDVEDGLSLTFDIGRCEAQLAT